MGRRERHWQDVEYVLKHFSDKTERARALYRSFVEEGVSKGRRSDLVGGGLVRSNEGWRPTKGAESVKNGGRPSIFQ
jgi:hypothetical protein